MANYTKRRAMFLAGGASLAMLVPYVAHAQSAASADAADEDVITVTAQFREQNVQRTPLAITAISSAMLESRSQTNLVQIAAQAPSVTLRPNGATFGPSLNANIRGVGQYDPSPAVEPGVGIYVDDVYYPLLTGSILDLLDLDRVEILRGPQGTLAGRNSIGGAVKLFSKKPQGDNSGFIQATYGSRNRLDIQGVADFSLTNSLSGRVSGAAHRQKGYVSQLDFGCVNPPGSALNPAVGGIAQRVSAASGCEVGKLGGQNSQAVRAQLRYDNGGPIEINLAADYTNEDRTPAGEALVYANNAAPWIRGNSPAVPLDSRFLCGRFCNFSTYFQPGGPFSGPIATGFPQAPYQYEPKAQFESWGVSGNIRWKLNDSANLTSITAYREITSFFTSDTDLTPLSVSAAAQSINGWSFSQELRLNGVFGPHDLVEYTLGGFYLDQRTTISGVQELGYVPFPGQIFLNDPVKASTKAVFGQLFLHPAERVTLIGGLRYTSEDKTYTFGRQLVNGAEQPFLPFNGRSGTYTGDRLDWRAGLQYEFSDGVMAYAQASTGFKGGGINPRPFTKFQIQPFDPETLTSYEVGLKTEFFDRRARINIAAYYSDYKDIQLTLLSCPQFSDPNTTADDNGPCAATANAGDGRIKGLEIETYFRPIDGLSIDGSLSYTDFGYKSIRPAAGGPTTPAGPQLDDVTPFTPKWKWSIGAQYDFDLGSAGILTPRIDIAYQSVTYSNAANSTFEKMPAYTLANGRLTWRNKADDLEVALEVTNISDRYYYLTAFDSSAGAGFATVQPGKPREWAVRVKKRF